ncbi:MAG: c-type cytochrome [Chloroflexota bacterium]
MPIVTLLRVLGLFVGGAALVIGLAAGAIYFITDNRLHQKVDIPGESIAIPTDITAVQRGQHLASAVAGCVECHGPNLAGKVFVDDPLLARIVPPNLTRGSGGVGALRTDADFARAIRHGLDPGGRQLLLMPSDDYNHFSDADLGAIIAYIRVLPSINTSLPANEVRVLGRILFAIGQLPLQPAAAIDHSAPRPAAPAAAVSVEYGKYLSDNAGCSSCHGPGLSGGQMPQARPNAISATNITQAGLGTWSEADFVRAMRTGVRPDGRAIATSMPWPYFAQLTDNELRAIWRFLQAVPPRPTGTR